MINDEEYRTRAMEKIIDERFKKTKCLAITGARQTGKSTIIQHMYKDMKRVNLKSDELLSRALEDPQLFLKNYKTPLFIDEVQRAPLLLNEVKVLMDETDQKSNFIFSGSQKWELMKGLSESLAGMVSILEMSPLSLREIYGIDFNEPFIVKEEYISGREKCLKKYDDIWQYIFQGFYPELYNQDTRDWQTFYQDYIRTYIEKDVYDLIKIKDSNMFYKFLVSVAARTGTLLNCANIASDIGVDRVTVSSWISVLEKTGLIYLLQPYYNPHLSRAIKTPKIYFRDTGLCAYLTNWNSKEALRDGAMSGNFFETFVVNEIIKSYTNKGKDYTHYIYYYRGKDKSNISDNEIDMIIEQDNTLYPIEIKKNAIVKSQMASTFQVLDKDITKKRGMGAIVCLCDERIYLRENLIALPIEYI